MSRPAPATPLGQATTADLARACDFLSTVHGRPVTGGHRAVQLADLFAACYADGHRAGSDQPQVPEPRDAWRQAPVRGGLAR